MKSSLDEQGSEKINSAKEKHFICFRRNNNNKQLLDRLKDI